MFCPKCGTENANDAKFCTGCDMLVYMRMFGRGAPVSNAPSLPNATDPMTFGKAISTCFTKYVDFSGRASKPEFWWFYLFTVLLSWVAIIVDSSEVLYAVVSLGLMLPTLAAGARRLHDTGRSGWWWLLAFTIIGIIPLIIWWASKGSDQNNEYGSPV